MAKRKRLKPATLTRFGPKPVDAEADPDAIPTEPSDAVRPAAAPKSRPGPVHERGHERVHDAVLERKSGYPLGVAPPARRAPIAQVAGDSATHAALEELVDEVENARAMGRLVLDIRLGEIKVDHLFRDRMAADPEDMAALKASLQARGQQTPIEVIALEGGGYGLISGWRRLTALGELQAETGESRFDTVQALIKPIETVTDSYVAMVEENEIRADLSFYERARLASEAARLGVYPDSMAAVRALFASGSRARRSKINSFVRLYEGLGAHLAFPTHIPERLGLALVKALDADPEFETRVAAGLKASPPATAEAERAVLERALRGDATSEAPMKPQDVAPGLKLQRKSGRLILSGKAVSDDLERDLIHWLQSR